MIKVSFACAFLLFSICYIGIQASPCPSSSNAGTVHSGRIIAALNSGNVPIFEGTDIQCYNYSLPNQFLTPPQVAVALHDFESERTNNLFFYVKPLHSDSLISVPFVIRTQWAYTRWTQLSFSFIAEDRNDIESNYYQIDSGLLTGCASGKSIDVLMPFRNRFSPNKIHYQLFLHGFQISTINFDGNTRSPFQIQIGQTIANVSGIAMSLTVLTGTQVNSIYISYIAYQKTNLNLIVGEYVYDSTISNVLSYTPEDLIPRSYARIYGITGFLINYNAQYLYLATSWDGFSFYFDLKQSNQLTEYLSFGYIFFVGSVCEGCSGYPIMYNGTCVNFCPTGTYRTPENFCLVCDIGKIWNGSECVKECPKGQYLDTDTNQCKCPPTTNWNGQSCISCSSGKVFIQQTKTCECPVPLKWNGYSCARLPDCTNGKEWDVYTYSCKCADTKFWNGTFCVQITPCKGGQVHNMNYECICPEKYYWNGQLCTFSPCVGGQIWQGTKCVCPVGLNFNGSMCVECINGQVWKTQINQCACQDGYKWNGQYCERTLTCTANRVWNATFEQCICRQGFYWSGYACLPVPVCYNGQYWDSALMKCVCSISYKWDGNKCVYCQNGQIWDPTNLKCYCPPGTIENRHGCDIQQACTGGKIFMQNTLKCECPETTVWNGQFCIMNPCSQGRQWSTEYNSCRCPGNKVWINERCVPPQISCTNGKIWNSNIYACECPIGTYPGAHSCESIPTCRNGMTYNPLTNQCTCPFGLILKNFQCVDPSCPSGQYWNSYKCQVISCPPPSYFYKNRCVFGDQDKCEYGYYWNGQSCVLFPNSCPLGTIWQNFRCEPSGACSEGFYLDQQGKCQPLSQPCIPPATWNGERCSIPGNQCPQGTYYSGGKCEPYTPCANGLVWQPNQLRCICPSGYIYNGNRCIQCPNGKQWANGIGCACPEGSFDTGSICESAHKIKCQSIPNSIWENDKCKCRPGFTKSGFQCICDGALNGYLCDKCSFKPFSQWDQSSRICKCKQGYSQIRGSCVPYNQGRGNDSPNQCNVGTYFDNNQKMCLPCPDGCLSCFDCYRCKVCRPEFKYDHTTEQCIQNCGDGRKFVLDCDDGNNQDGDGCSRDCKIESGYTCTGGSPDNKDNCYNYRPDRIDIIQTGVIRRSTSIVVNVKLNYVPNSLLFSDQCSNSCSQILTSSLIDGDKSAISVVSKYVAGSKYSFTITVDFGRPYIGEFKMSVGVNKDLINRYFGGISVPNKILEINPAYLAKIDHADDQLS